MYKFRYSLQSGNALVYKDHESVRRITIYKALGERPGFCFDRDRIYTSEDLSSLLIEFHTWRNNEKYKQAMPQPVEDSNDFHTRGDYARDNR